MHRNFVPITLDVVALASNDASPNGGSSGNDLCVVTYVEKATPHHVWFINRFKAIMQINFIAHGQDHLANWLEAVKLHVPVTETTIITPRNTYRMAEINS